VDYAFSSEPDAAKRRTTRIVQSIPLTVLGIEPNGQAFKERTSTLIINCHGCKFLSRHEVPQHSTITLEVLHPEPGNEPRRVRARVTFVQKPKMGHELFQIGVELETPGNVWGIAFPPQDWFPYPEPGAPSLPAPAKSAAAETRAPLAAVPRSGAPDLPATPSGPSGTVIMPPTTAQADPALRAAATRILAEQAIPVFADMRKRLDAAAEKALEQAVHSYHSQLMRRAVEHLEAARKENVAALQDEWSVLLNEGVQHARRRMAVLAEESALAARETFSRRVADEVASVTALVEAAARRAEALERGAHDHLAMAEAQLNELQQRIDATMRGLGGFGAELEATTEAARARVAGEARHAVHQAIIEVEEGLGKVRRDLEARAGEFRAEQEAHFRALQESASRLRGELAETVEETRRTWRDSVESDMAHAGTQWNAMLDAAVQSAAGRLRSDIGEMEEQAAERVAAQAATRLTTQIATANAAADELERTQKSVAEFLRDREEELRDSCEQLTREAAAQVQADAARLRREFDAEAQALRAKWIEELEAKGTDTIQGVFQYFTKASEWYQKKAQTSVSAVADRLLEETSTRLRDQAAEVARLCAMELNHQSASYVEHTRGMLEEARNDLAGRARQQLDDLRGVAATTFEAEVHNLSRETQDGLRALEAQAREGMGRAADESFEEFHARLAEASRVWADQSLSVLEGRSQTAIDRLTKVTQDRVADALSGVVTDFAENLRARLLGVNRQES
jgi:hypothetical protein